jgi:single-strand DNA-binding protein
MINKHTIVGNVGQAPKVNHINGVKIANISVATTDVSIDQQGNRIESTEWHNVTAFGKLADIVEKYVQKGSQLYIDGKVTTRSYEKDGTRHYRTSTTAATIKLLGHKPKDGIVQEPSAPNLPATGEPPY